MARIVVSGYMIRYPLAGALLAYFHYVLGLHRLGHEVAYVEESGWPGSCYDPERRDYGDDPSAGMRAVGKLFAGCGVPGPVCYVDRDSGQVHGGRWEDVKRVLGAADLLLNLGGVCWLPEFRLCPRRALVDMDPFFTQAGRFGAEALAEHHLHFTYGGNVGRAGCTIPSGGIEWRATVPPVVLDLWPCTALPPVGAPFTTVASWSAYGGIDYGGEFYGQKDQEFLRLVDLPGHTTQPLEVALSGGGQEVTQRLESAGWSVRPAGDVTADLPAYQSYIARSRGELSVAKHAYVKTHSGWFSDRSVCYLAAGRPAILQDTGFTDWLPSGRGVLAFTSLEEAVDRIQQVNAHHAAHCQAAREIAANTFGHDVVLPRLVEAL